MDGSSDLISKLPGLVRVPTGQLQGLQLILCLLGDGLALADVFGAIAGCTGFQLSQRLTQRHQSIQSISSRIHSALPLNPAESANDFKFAGKFHLLVGRLHAGRRVHVQQDPGSVAHRGVPLHHRPGQHHDHEHYGAHPQQRQNPETWSSAPFEVGAVQDPSRHTGDHRQNQSHPPGEIAREMQARILHGLGSKDGGYDLHVAIL